MNGCTEVVKLVLDYNIDPSLRGNGVKIPLTEASYRGHRETVELLLNRGAHPDTTNIDGRSPFLWACYNSSIEIVRALLDYSAVRTGAFGTTTHYDIEFDRRDEQGKNAISYALDHGHHETIQLLREKDVLAEQDPHIDKLFCNWRSHSRGGDGTATVSHIGPAIGWPFIDAQGVVNNEHKPSRPSFKFPLCTQRPTFRNARGLLRHGHTRPCSNTRWTCLYCGKSFPRRGKFGLHIKCHGKTQGNVSDSKVELDPPANCLICPVPLSSWAAFNSCIVKHSKTD